MTAVLRILGGPWLIAAATIVVILHAFILILEGLEAAASAMMGAACSAWAA